MEKIIPDYLHNLSSFLQKTSYSEIPENIIDRSRLVFADSMAAIIGGSAEPEVEGLTKRMLLSKNSGTASVLGTGLSGEPMTVSVINGSAGTFLEMDEGNQFCRGHPGMQVIPAILAQAEIQGASGRDLLRALILGYEIGARIGIACRLRMTMHPHGTWGTIGAAVGVGALQKCAAKEFQELINS